MDVLGWITIGVVVVAGIALMLAGPGSPRPPGPTGGGLFST